MDVEDPVLVLAPQHHSKLKASYQGPYQILEKITPVTYLIDIPRRNGKGHQLHVNMLKKWNTPSASVMAIGVVAEPSEMSDEESEIITWDVNGPNQPTDDLTSEQKRQMKEIMNKREKSFHPVPGKTNQVEQSIRLSQTVSVRRPMYRVPAALHDPVRKELKSILKQGIIEPSTSPWSHSLVPVKKLKIIPMEVGLCGDFQPINVDTLPDPYLMPRTEELLDRIGNVKFISVFDLRKGFYQVPMKDEDKPKTASMSIMGIFQFTRMPFGLKVAPANLSEVNGHPT